MKPLLSNTAKLLTVYSLLFLCRASAKIPVNVDDLDPLKDCKRREVKLIESDNKVYMYGGQSWVKNGTEEPFQITNHYLRIVDFTAPHNLNDSSILTAKDIPGNISIFQTGAFWADSSKVYVVGGAVNDEPWLSREGEFLPSNYSAYKGSTVFSYEIGADKWSSESAVQPNSGSGVIDSFCCGSFAYNAGYNRAYYYSGSNSAGARKLDPDTVPGYVGRSNEDTFGNGNLLTFDTGTFKWSNVTTDTQLTTTGTENGQFVYLPGTDASSGGIAILIGGMRRDTSDMESMRKVLVYDSGTNSWYGQATTAESDFPPGRWFFCAVAASAPDNSSHNIFMYGGESPDATSEAFSDLWILSVPSFHWMRVNVESPPKKSLGCTTVAERFMVTYGGVKAGFGNEGDDEECDQENFGLRLFDMPILAWTEQYDGPLEDGKHGFTVPKLVYDVIGGNEQGGATQTAPSAGFETAALAGLFPRSSPTSAAPTSPGSATASPTGASTASNKKSSNTGAIVGGVVGGLAVLAIIIVGALCLMKRRRNSRAVPARTAAPYEVDGEYSYPRELAGNGPEPKQHVHEMYGEQQGWPPQEMYAGHDSPMPRNAVAMK